MTVANWWDTTEAEEWDSLSLGGELLPGTVTVNVSIPDGRDRQKGKGSRKTRHRDDGDKGVEFDVEVELTPEELSDFERRIVPLLRKRNKDGARDPLEIGHPQAAIWGVDVVTVGKISGKSPSPGGTCKIGFDLGEWSPEPKEIKKPKETPDDGSNGKGEAPPPTIAEQALGNAFPGGNKTAAKRKGIRLGRR